MIDNWHSVLHELSKNIQSKITEVIPKRNKLPYTAFKSLLDSQAQEAIVEILREKKVDAKLISEEGDLQFRDGKYIITADPVDGTTNLSRGLQPSVLSISVATEPNQNSVIASIVTNFYTGKTYYAEKNRGASLEEFPIKPAKYCQYKDSLIGLDLSKKPDLDKTYRLILESNHIREEGCSASSLCHVADGTLDAHIDVRNMVRATDISAGLFIIREAGGIYSVNRKIFGDLQLARDSNCEVIAASTRKLHDEILRIIEKE